MDVRKTQEINGINVYCDLLEKVATGEHEQWSHWTKHLLDNYTPENIERWRKQIQTPYSELTREEQESDIVWARKVLNLTFNETNIMNPSITIQGRCWSDIKKRCVLTKCCYDACCQALFNYWKFANSDKWKEMVEAELTRQALEKSAYQQIDDLFYSQGLKGKLEFMQLLEKIKVILGESE